MEPLFDKKEMIVVGLGGNAIMDAKGKAPFDEQANATSVTMRSVAELIAGGTRVVITHGNGPIVGNILIRNEAASDQIPPMPLHVCVADSVGGLGYMIQQSLLNELIRLGVERNVVTLVNQILVSGSDPAFGNPTKPIGPFYGKEEADHLHRHLKWQMVEDSGRGWRRIVPSPQPISILEAEPLRKLIGGDTVVIAVGGGGIPVVRNRQGLYSGVDAVIDKDWASVLLAREIGATWLALLTGVERVALRYGKEGQVDLERIDVETASDYMRRGEFPPGSMGPKIAAAIAFIEGGGKGVLITSPDHLIDGLEGRTGTWIVPDPPGR